MSVLADSLHKISQEILSLSHCQIALIQEAGGSAFVYGISSGACLALEAASGWATGTRN
jgi:hypothetical protein